MIALYIFLGLIALIVILLHISVTVYLTADKENGVKYTVKYLFFTLYPRADKLKKNKRKKQKQKKQKEEPEPLDEKELEAELERLENEDIDDFDELFEDEPESWDEPEINSVDSIEPVDKKAAKQKAKEEKKRSKKAEKAAKEAKKQEMKEKHKSDSSDEGRGGLGGLIDKFNYYKPLFPMGWKYFKKLLKAIRFYDTDILLVTAKPDAYDSAMFYGKLQIALNNLMALLCGIFTVRIKRLGVKCEFNDYKLDYYAGCKVKLRPSTVIAIAVCVLINYLLFRHRRKKEAKKEKPSETAQEQTQEKLSA